MGMYTDEQRVEDELPKTIITPLSDTSEPTKGQVGDFIAEEEAIVNGKLAHRYDIPITGTDALQIVSRICTHRVVRRCMSVHFSGAPDDTPPMLAAILEESAQLLEELRTGAMQLPGGVEGQDWGSGANFRDGETTAQANDANADFKRGDEDDW